MKASLYSDSTASTQRQQISWLSAGLMLFFALLLDLFLQNKTHYPFAPDFTLLAYICLMTSYRSQYGVITGLWLGFALDILQSTLLGFNAFIYCCLATAFSLILRNNNQHQTEKTSFMPVFLLLTLHELLFNALGLLFYPTQTVSFLILHGLLALAINTAFLLVLLFAQLVKNNLKTSQ